MSLALLVLLLAGCGGTQTGLTPSSAPAATRAILPTATPAQPTPTLTFTPVPPTATQTAVPPTARSTLETGSVKGTLVGKESSEHFADAHVLLCEIADPTASEPECLLHVDLATVTGPDGAFGFTDVPLGAYGIVYGMPDEVQGTPETWEGCSVRYYFYQHLDP